MHTYISKIAELALVGVEKGISRKFAAWVVATVGLFTDYIPSDAWMTITLLYIGVQGALDYLKNKA